MKLTGQRAQFGLLANSEPRSSNVEGKLRIGAQETTVPLTQSNTIYSVTGTLGDGDRLILDLSTNDASDSELAKSVILDPAGDNNAIKITSTDADILAAEILIDDDVDRTGLTVTSGPLLSIASGDKRVMRVTGSLLDKDGNPFVFDDMLFVSSDANESLWEAGDFGSGAYFSVGMNPVSGGWQFTLYYSLNGADTAEWKSEVFPTSGGAPIYPDLATTWTVFQERGEGTPTVTAHPATAAQTIAAINAEEIEGITASNAPGDDGSGFIGNVESTNFVPDGEIIGGNLADWEGDPLGTLTKVTGFQITILTGSGRVEVNGDEIKTMTAGETRQSANPNGMPSYLEPLELTATSPNTQFSIVVTGEI
jgi:hypothetical protein